MKERILVKAGRQVAAGVVVLTIHRWFSSFIAFTVITTTATVPTTSFTGTITTTTDTAAAAASSMSCQYFVVGLAVILRVD